MNSKKRHILKDGKSLSFVFLWEEKFLAMEFKGKGMYKYFCEGKIEG